MSSSDPWCSRKTSSSDKRSHFCPMKIVLILANSADPDELHNHAEFHLGLHCLSKYAFRGFQYTKG